MKPLFTSRPFTDFGLSRLAITPPRVHEIAGPRPSALRRQVRELCPRLPGVYAMVNEHSELIYVGKAKNLRARLLSYFRTRSRDRRATRIVRHAVRIVWEASACEFAALHRELELIRRWRPRFNLMGRPGGWRYTYVCVGRAPAPYVFLSQRASGGVLARFGPIRAGRRAAEAVRRLNDSFSLRDCPTPQEMHFADQMELFPQVRAPGCLRLEIGTCLGPCAGACAESAYSVQVRRARAFLEGKDRTLLKKLQSEMSDAARAQAFERAAALRDKLDALGWLARRLEQLRELRQHGSFIYPAKPAAGPTIWYLIRDGCAIAALPEPQNPHSRSQAAKLIEAVYHPSRRHATAEQIDSTLLVAAWFRRHPGERRRCLQPPGVR